MRCALILWFFLFSLKGIGQETQKKDRETLFIQQINLELLDKRFDNSKKIDFNRQKENQQLIVTQLGDGNLLGIKSDANDFQKIRQQGSNNYYNFIDYYNSRQSNINVLQLGKSNSLHVYGTNSFTDKIEIVQKSDYKSIVIRNF